MIGQEPVERPVLVVHLPIGQDVDLPPREAVRMEKQAIQQRLQQYREAHGPGCLAAVAAAITGKPIIPDMTLRDVLNGAAVLPIRDWRRIGKALDGLEPEVTPGE